MDTNFLDIITTTIANYISIPFILSVNLMTFFVIKQSEKIYKRNYVVEYQKRLITLIISLLFFGLFYMYKISNPEVLTLSLFIVPLSYNYVLKRVLKMAGISYKSEDLKLF